MAQVKISEVKVGDRLYRNGIAHIVKTVDVERYRVQTVTLMRFKLAWYLVEEFHK